MVGHLGLAGQVACKPGHRVFGPATTTARRPVRVSANGEAGTSRSKGSKASDTNGAPMPESTPHQAFKVAAAAKISAAKSLARKLSEEQKAAAAAARAGTQRNANPGKAKELAELTKAQATDLAKQAAQADSLARAARKAEQGEPHVLELQRLKTENEALQRLVLQLASNKADAERRLAAVKDKFSLGVAGDSTDSAASADASKASRTKSKGEEASPPSLSTAEIQRLASAASAAGNRTFSVPEGRVAVGTTIRLYYDRAAGPLPAAEVRPTIKVGWNGWETQQTLPLRRVASLEAGEWWCADLGIPDLLTRAEFVVYDEAGGVHDNNSGSNFVLELEGAVSEQQLHVRRLELFEAAEAARRRELEAEEGRLHQESMVAAQAASKAARAAFRVRKERAAGRAAALAVARRRRGLEDLTAAPQREGVYAWLGGEPRAGARATLAYNLRAGPLRGRDSAQAVIGFDNWHLKGKTVVKLEPLSDAQVRRHGLSSGTWVAATVELDEVALVVDFVFCDERREAWDNNERRDYHTALAGALADAELAARLARAALERDADATARQEDLAAKRALEKAEIKYEAAKARRAAQAAFLYTRPTTPRAGEAVELLYNPDLTPLRGRPEVWVRGGFNRWTAGNFPPQAMRATGVGGFHATTIQVPRAAHVLDLVFLDSGDAHGGFTDDNRGLDYHLPVAGGQGALDPLRVVHVAAEMAPIAKEGGLGDVVTALGRAVQEEGHEVEIVLPKYDCINYDLVEDLKLVKEFWYNGVEIKVWKGIVEDLHTTFLEPCNGMFWVGRIYTEMNADRHRFGVWCEAALEYLRHHAEKRIPDILHAHDWQSAPCTWLDCGTARTAFTIHNLNYGADLIERAMGATAVATTVSPTYAQEVSGHPAVAPNHAKFHGIRNGIDPEIWDPAEDEFLPRSYSADTFTEGKAAAKAELRAKMNLCEADVPLVGVVTRLTHQKGVHLIKHAAWRTLERGGQFVLLGSAPDARVQAEFNALAADLARQYPDRARLWFAYNEPLSHLIYAGADMLLVPSMFEPCGLTQMIAMRYGTIPVVRKTGGLNDTVFDVDHDVERAAAAGMAVNGFSFEGTDGPGIDYALNRALTAWYSERAWWQEMTERVMRMDWSWAKPALEYIELYYKALRR
ncbi:SSS3B [Auxenochlorella protothecoides x Auxenochlorella symbiontica]